MISKYTLKDSVGLGLFYNIFYDVIKYNLIKYFLVFSRQQFGYML